MAIFNGNSCGGGGIPQLCEQVETFTAILGNLSVTLRWTAPLQDQDNSFVGTKIVKKVGSYPITPRDGTTVYEGTGFEFTDDDLTEDTTYYYRAFAYNNRLKYQTSMRVVEVTAHGYLKASELPVGALVSIPFENTPTNFRVVHHGLPSSDYSTSCNGTWLMAELLPEVGYLYDPQGGYGANNYAYSQVHERFNDTYSDKFSQNTLSHILDIKIPYQSDGNSGATNFLGENGLPTKFFIPSATEVGLSNPTNIKPYGAKLDYFDAGNDPTANNKRIAFVKYDTAQLYKEEWWLRSAYLPNNLYANVVTTTGIADASATNPSTGASLEEKGVRTSFIIDDNTYFNGVPNAEGAYEIIGG